MRKEQFIELLELLYSLKRIDARLMQRLIDQFDDIDTGMLPVVLTVDDLTAVELVEIELALLLLFGLSSLKELRFHEVARQLRIGFENDIRAVALPSGRAGSLKAWQAGVLDVIRKYYATMTLIGYRGEFSDVVTARLNGELRNVERYLMALSGEILVSQLNERPFSERLTQHRALLFGGAGWMLGHWANEMDGGDVGWVVDYIDVDDHRTCNPCRVAGRESPYLPGEGPMPGVICLGRYYCRCERVLRYDIDAYMRLIGVGNQ